MILKSAGATPEQRFDPTPAGGDARGSACAGRKEWSGGGSGVPWADRDVEEASWTGYMAKGTV